ncbi:MAG: RICIN domain-containing protein, partial [Allobaculum sp.]|nr:RICIN domain-containing protein [Allobaculum sp.]
MHVRIHHPASGKYLGVAPPNGEDRNGARLQLQDYQEGNNLQVFYLKNVFNDSEGHRYYQIRVHGEDNKIIEVRNSSFDDWGEVAQWTDHSLPCSLWCFFTENPQGGYDSPICAIQNYNSGKLMNIAGGKYYNGTNLIQFQEDNTPSEFFQIINVEAGSTGSAIRDIYYVNTNSQPLNMRSGPGTGYSAITSIPKGTQVNLLEYNIEWSLIEYGGRTGYVSTQYLGRRTEASGNIGNGNFSSQIVSYSQRDARWANHGYGLFGNGTRATLASSGCGILALTNLTANLTGNFISPQELGDYAVTYGYRINGVGTSHSLYRSFCNNRGGQYGIRYQEQTGSWITLQNALQTGNTGAIVYNSGHIMAVVRYNSSTGEYLLIDSEPSYNRGTSSGYAWKTQGQLQALGIRSDFHLISRN